jgi:trigger factor
MLEREIDNVIESLKERLAQQNQDLDLYLKTRKMDLQGLQEEVRPIAEERLKKSLVLLELSEAEKIHLDPEEVQSETSRTLEMMSRMLPEKEARRLSDRDTVSGLVGNIMMDMVTHRTLDRIRDIASGKAELEASRAAEAEAEQSNAEAEPAKAEMESTEREGLVEPVVDIQALNESEPGKAEVASTPEEPTQAE